MGKTATETANPMNRNPTGKGGFGERKTKGPGRGHKKPRPAATDSILADMEKAYSTAELPTDSPLVKAFRRMVHEEPAKFLNQYVKLKGGEPVMSDAAAAATVGPKEEAVEELAERLLHEWETENAPRG